jgi:hypothetical protein
MAARLAQALRMMEFHGDTDHWYVPSCSVIPSVGSSRNGVSSTPIFKSFDELRHYLSTLHAAALTCQ